MERLDDGRPSVASIKAGPQMSEKKPNYDYTATARSATRRQRTARTLTVDLDQQHASALEWITCETDETAAACVRRLIREEASRRDAPGE